MAWLWGRNASGSAQGAGEVDAESLRAELANGADLVLLDVRQDFEHASGHLPGAKLIPLPELPSRKKELDPARDIVVYCRSGHRSALACRALRGAGFTRVRNLSGGYLAWAEAQGR